jgi:hypothetical protein
MILNSNGDEVRVLRVATAVDNERAGHHLSFRDLQSDRWLFCRLVNFRKPYGPHEEMICDRYSLTADRGQREIKEALKG